MSLTTSNISGSNISSYTAYLQRTTGPSFRPLTENLKSIFTDETEIEACFICDGCNNHIDKNRLIGILNKIAETKAGCNILKALKIEIALINENANREPKNYIKVNISLCNSEYNQYSFTPPSNGNDCLDVIINTKPISEERCIFDQNKIITHTFPADEKTEAYSIAHELTHVVSFLNFFAKNPGGDWDKRKNADTSWIDFFYETEQMKNVYHGLLLDGFTPKQIIDTFRVFFINTEEARNVLGLVKGTVDGQETLIGEGAMFKELNPSNEGIVTYLGEEKQPQTDIEKAVLKNIRDMFDYGLSFTRDSQESVDAKDVLGSQFAGFNLVNVPRENSAIAAALEANGESLDRVDEINNNISNSLQNHNLDLETSYCMNHDALRGFNFIAYSIYCCYPIR